VATTEDTKEPNMGNGFHQKLNEKFFKRSVDKVARDLVGKILVREKSGKTIVRMRIITTEAYGGGENSSMPDTASHSHENYRGNNKNVSGQELEGGNIYIAYSRGDKKQFNITTGDKNDAQAVLIKECQLLYKDNRPNKEDNTNKGFLTEQAITGELGLHDISVGGYSMEEVGISVFSDGDLIENTKRKNIKNDNPWRFSISRLWSLLIVL
jgi:3-methyladenine DNA glycosylase Mpg